MSNLPSPKLSSKEQSNGTALYPYYAGFSYDFAKTSIQKFKKDNMLVLDPWTGTGLTNKVSQELGIASIGIDINPVMATVAKANMISIHCTLSIRPLCSDIINKVKRKKGLELCSESDPLLQWFSHDTVITLRSLDMSIYKLLVDEKPRKNLMIDVVKLSELACFFYIVMFKITKKLIKKNFPTSNPSWIKTPKKDSVKITLTKHSLLELFLEEVLDQTTLLGNFKYTSESIYTEINMGESQNLIMDSNTVDLVVTSPPYCTRIDYAVLTKPELAVLGFETNYFKDLRMRMIGTTAIDKTEHQINPKWGRACYNFLNEMSEHTSVASKTYYLKNHIQYFSGMEKSIEQIHRVLKKGGDAILVVQDSYYKELHNNLPLFIEEIASEAGLYLENRNEFKVHSISNINRKSLKYRSSKPLHESVLHFRK